MLNGTHCYRVMFQLTRGIRQGGVLSPYLFALYVDDVMAIVEKRRTGCFYRSMCVSIVMYADDILLLSPSVTVLQELLYVCEKVLGSLDLSINPKKSVCTRVFTCTCVFNKLMMMMMMMYRTSLQYYML